MPSTSSSSSLGWIGGSAVTVREALPDASREASPEASPESRTSGWCLRPFVLGSVDGLITSFVIVAGGLAADVDKGSVGILGVSSLVADGFSMGVSEYLSSRPSTTTARAALMGFVCFASFVAFGALPLGAYLLATTHAAERVASLLAFAASLVGVGLVRGRVEAGEGRRWWQSLGEVTLLGASAGGLAYAVASVKLP